MSKTTKYDSTTTVMVGAILFGDLTEFGVFANAWDATEAVKRDLGGKGLWVRMYQQGSEFFRGHTDEMVPDVAPRQSEGF